MKTAADPLYAILHDAGLLSAHISTLLTSHIHKTYRYFPGQGIPAAVLIPVFFKKGEAHLLLTKRTDHLEHHKGQVAFPGGKADAADIDLLHTALRETEEEVGIQSGHIQVLGRTDAFLTNTNFMVTPYVGLFEHPYPFRVSHGEIDRLIEVPLNHLLRDDIFEMKPYRLDNQEFLVHYYHYEEDLIWGVTGFLLSNFLALVFGKTGRMELHQPEKIGE